MKLEAMTMNDYNEVYHLWRSTQGMGLNETDDAPEGIARFLKRNPDTCFVAREERQLVGVILAGHDGRRGYIYHTATAVEYRKQGIGSALVDAALMALEKADIHKVALVVFGRNELGNRFWESKGFTLRNDIYYRNRSLCELKRIDT